MTDMIIVTIKETITPTETETPVIRLSGIHLDTTVTFTISEREHKIILNQCIACCIVSGSLLYLV